MTRRLSLAIVAGFALAFVPLAAVVRAHSGPPFPILSNRIQGAYDISIWSDPDTTDDGRPAGQFWILLKAADGSAIPDATHVAVTIKPSDRPGAEQSGTATPVKEDRGNQFVALLMDHEGPYAVRVRVDGPLGSTEVESQVDATYDARPPRGLLIVYLIPFVALGGLWMKALARRRGKRSTARG